MVILLVLMLFLISCSSQVQEEIILDESSEDLVEITEEPIEDFEEVEEIEEIDQGISDVEEILENLGDVSEKTILKEPVEEVVEEVESIEEPIEKVSTDLMHIDLIITPSVHDIILVRGILKNNGVDKVYIPSIKIDCFDVFENFIVSEIVPIERTSYPIGDLEFQAQLKGETENLDTCTAEIV